jgi:hypothetical protein
LAVERYCRAGWRDSWRGVTALAALLVAGCGGANTLYPVGGTVYLDGQPAKELAGGTVTFNSGELHKSASGQIHADGTYRLGSLRQDDGVLAGKYEVTVAPPEAAARGERGGRPRTAPALVFEGPTEREVTVERRANDIPLHLRRKPAPPH